MIFYGSLVCIVALVVYATSECGDHRLFREISAPVPKPKRDRVPTRGGSAVPKRPFLSTLNAADVADIQQMLTRSHPRVFLDHATKQVVIEDSYRVDEEDFRRG